MSFKRIDKVVAWRLCMGCGACAASCSNKAIKMVDFPELGVRPVVDQDLCQQCSDCVKVCPGIDLHHKSFEGDIIDVLKMSWGPVLEIWEGFAADEEIRFKASSGGVATALALFFLEQKQINGVMQVGPDQDQPLKNSVYLTTTRNNLINCTGSRYSPAAGCENLGKIENSELPNVFIGKPCEVAAVRKWQKLKSMDSKIDLAISIFCAGTPATKGTIQILKTLDVKPGDVETFRYRGFGWPGKTAVKVKAENMPTKEMTYDQCWGEILSKYTQFRCKMCPDSTGEFADISCGDPWYKRSDDNDPGQSLVVVRTQKGKEILKQAMDSGYVNLHRVESFTLPGSQKSLLSKRRNLWGRLLALRLFCIPTPVYKGFSLFENFKTLSFINKIKSIGGTIKRIITRGWTRPLKTKLSENS